MTDALAIGIPLLIVLFCMWSFIKEVRRSNEYNKKLNESEKDKHS